MTWMGIRYDLTTQSRYILPTRGRTHLLTLWPRVVFVFGLLLVSILNGLMQISTLRSDTNFQNARGLLLAGH